MHVILAALFFAVSSVSALAQSTTATTGVTKPITTAPASGDTLPNGQPKVKIPPAARSGESGLRIGQGAATGEPIEVKRLK